MMTGAKMQPEFNHNMDEQPAANYRTVQSGGALQDALREQGGQLPAADKVTDKFSDNAGDNSLTRYEINQSLTAPEVTNEHSFAQAMERAVNEIGKDSKP